MLQSSSSNFTHKTITLDIKLYFVFLINSHMRFIIKSDPLTLPPVSSLSISLRNRCSYGSSSSLNNTAKKFYAKNRSLKKIIISTLINLIVAFSKGIFLLMLKIAEKTQNTKTLRVLPSAFKAVFFLKHLISCLLCSIKFFPTQSCCLVPSQTR